MTITSLISNLPPAPSRERPGSFATEANSFLSALVPFAEQLNEFGMDVNSTIAEINQSESSVNALYNLVLAAAGTTSRWTSGSTYTSGQLVFSPINYQTYRRTDNSPGSSTTDPSADATRWTQITSNTSGGLSLSGSIVAGTGAGVGSASIELGQGRTGDGASFIDLHSQSGVDYSTRINRGAGANGGTQIIHNGSGTLELNSVNNGPVQIKVNNTTRATFDSNGNMVLANGVTTGPGSTTKLTVSGNNFSSSSAQFSRFSADNDGAYVFFNKSRSSDLNQYTIVNSDDTLGRVIFYGADGSQMRFGAQIRVSVSGTPSATAIPSTMFVTLSDSLGAQNEVFRLLPTGSVMLGGTASPVSGFTNYKLCTSGGSLGSSSSYQMRYTNDDDGPYMVLGKSRGTTPGSGGAVLAGDTLGTLAFASTGSGSTATIGPEIKGVSEVAGVNGTGNGGLRFYIRNAGTSTEMLRMTQAGDNVMTVRNNATPSALPSNNNMVFTLTSNTNLRISVRGSDGVTRVANITLA